MWAALRPPALLREVPMAQLARLELPTLAGALGLAVLVLDVIRWIWPATRAVNG